MHSQKTPARVCRFVLVAAMMAAAATPCAGLVRYGSFSVVAEGTWQHHLIPGIRSWALKGRITADGTLEVLVAERAGFLVGRISVEERRGPDVVGSYLAFAGRRARIYIRIDLWKSGREVRFTLFDDSLLRAAVPEIDGPLRGKESQSRAIRLKPWSHRGRACPSPA